MSGATETVYRGRIVTLEVQEGKWEVVRHRDAVSIVALRDGKMLCVRQYRRAIGTSTLEVPAGLIDDGEDPETAANRELAEEAGLNGDLTLLTRFYPSPGFCDEHLLVYRAVNLREATGTPDDDEDITLEWHAPADVLRWLRDGTEVGSAATVTAALLALQELHAGREA